MLEIFFAQAGVKIMLFTPTIEGSRSAAASHHMAQPEADQQHDKKAAQVFSFPKGLKFLEEMPIRLMRSPCRLHQTHYLREVIVKYIHCLFGISLFFILGCSSGPQSPHSGFGNTGSQFSGSGQTGFASARMPDSFHARLSQGDRHVGWALTYYESWKRGRQQSYLALAEEHIQEAVIEFADLQSQTSPRISEFYVARERRVRSCRFLAEVQFAANNSGFATLGASPGCSF